MRLFISGILGSLSAAVLMILLAIALAALGACAPRQKLAPRVGAPIPVWTPQATDQCEQPDAPDWCPELDDADARPA